MRQALRLVVDVVVAAVMFAVIAVLLGSARARDAITIPSMQLPITLAAAAAGAGAAILAVVASRLLGDRRLTWIAAALVLYCVIILPWSTLAPYDTLDLAQRASRLVVHLAAVVLLVLSVRPPRLLGSWGGWVLMSAGGLLAAGALWLPDDAAVHQLIAGPELSLVVLGGWTAVAVAFVVDGARQRSAPRLRLGFGLVVLAVAQIYRAVSAVPSTAAGNLPFAVLRLLGLAMMLVALWQLVQRALGALRAEQWQQQEELAAAALSRELTAELAAERDHELRNGLAGLAGITHLLSAENDDIDHVHLEHAVLAELGRLHLILDGEVTEPDGHDSFGPEADYPVEPVLSGLVTLRRSRGEQLQLHVEPGLHARGRSPVLAQIVTNLLGNCDRHAPGAPVTVTARRGGDGVVVEVRDTGPGLATGTEDEVLGRGVHDESAGGSGLGLHISRQLVAREGGSLTLRSVDHPCGCLATVTVPLAAHSGQEGLCLHPTVVPFIRQSRRSSDLASAAAHSASPRAGKPPNR